MRRYIIVSGILLILSIIDFALAAPVLAQEKCQACVDVVGIPEDAMATLGKRGGEWEELFNKWYYEGMWGKPKESSGAPASSSSAPSSSEPPGPDHGSTSIVEGPAPGSEPLGPDHGSTSVVEGPAPGLAPSGSTPSGPDHGSTNVVEVPAANPASSIANPDHPLMEPSGPPPPGSSEYHVWEPPSAGQFKGPQTLPWWSEESYWDQEAMDTYRIPEHLFAYAKTDHSAPASPEAGSEYKYPGSQPNPRPSNPGSGSSNPNPSESTDYDYYYALNLAEAPPSRLGSQGGSGSAYEYQGMHPSASQGPTSQIDSDWLYAWKLANAPPSRPGSPTGYSDDYASGDKVELPPSTPGPMSQIDSDRLYAWKLANAPPSRPGSPTGYNEDYASGDNVVHPPSTPGPMSQADWDQLHAWSLANAPQSRPGLSTGFGADHEPSPEEPHPPSPSSEVASIQGMPTNTEHEALYRPPSSPVESSNIGQPVNAEDVQAAIYNWKGKEKQPVVQAVDPTQEASSSQPAD